MSHISDEDDVTRDEDILAPDEDLETGWPGVRTLSPEERPNWPLVEPIWLDLLNRHEHAEVDGRAQRIYDFDRMSAFRVTPSIARRSPSAVKGFMRSAAPRGMAMESGA